MDKYSLEVMLRAAEAKIAKLEKKLNKFKPMENGRLARLKNGKTIPDMQGNAGKRDLEWTIGFDEYNALYDNPCHYCNRYIDGKGTGLDRIDNTKGYSLDNVLRCCWKCNRIRGDLLSVEEMEKVATQLPWYIT